MTPKWLSFLDHLYRAGRDEVWEAMEPVLREADLILVPGFPLHHPDHLWVTRLVYDHEEELGPIGQYVEQPYAELEWTGQRRVPEREPLLVEPRRASVSWTRSLPSASAWMIKQRAVWRYSSQARAIASPPARLLARTALYEFGRGGEYVALPERFGDRDGGWKRQQNGDGELRKGPVLRGALYRRSSRRRPGVTICGGGNGGHALAVVASQNFDGDIDWLVGSEEKAALLRRAGSAGGLRSTGAIEATADRLRTITADPAEVIPQTGMVLIVVPAFAHAAVLRRIRPYITDGTIIGCLPTRGGFEFEAAQLIPRRGGARRIFGLQTLPWSTRVVTPGKVVNVGAVKAEVVLASLPAEDGSYMAARLSQILGMEIVPADGFLNLTLGNPGQFIHAGLMYGHFHRWRGEEYDEDSIPLLYAQASDDMGAVVERLSEDALAVARAIELQSAGALNLQGVLPVHEWLRASYSHVTADLRTVASCFRTGPIQARQAPVIETRPGKFIPNFEYRYLSEDVPYGLVITRALAELAEVETPTIDDVLNWAQGAMKKDYLVGGELVGRDVTELPIPQRHGVFALPDLIDWYSDEVSDAPRPREHASAL